MNDEQKIREIIREEIGKFSDRFIFEKMFQFLDGNNIQLGRNIGTKIGTATDQLLAFYGATPVDQPVAINAPSGGATVDAEARTAINTIISRLKELGLIAS